MGGLSPSTPDYKGDHNSLECPTQYQWWNAIYDLFLIHNIGSNNNINFGLAFVHTSEIWSFLHLFAFQEQEKIAKNALDMKLANSDLEAEAEKWGDENYNDENNDIVRRAKNMSSMGK